VNDEEFFTLSEGLGGTRLPYRRDILPDLRLRTLDREFADSVPSRYGPAAALAAASALQAYVEIVLGFPIFLGGSVEQSVLVA